jgi:hypothetical protein
MRETQIEALFDRHVRRDLGGETFKILPTISGLPDRIAVLPGGVTHWVELKAPGGRLRPVQIYRHGRLRALGATVTVLTNRDAVLQWDPGKEPE